MMTFIVRCVTLALQTAPPLHTPFCQLVRTNAGLLTISLHKFVDNHACIVMCICYVATQYCTCYSEKKWQYGLEPIQDWPGSADMPYHTIPYRPTFISDEF